MDQNLLLERKGMITYAYELAPDDSLGGNGGILVPFLLFVVGIRFPSCM